MKRGLYSALLSILMLSILHAEEPVYFADPSLKAAVEHALWVSDPTPADMLELTMLTSNSKGIATLTGLEYAANLQELTLRQNEISDISPLAGLMFLRTLILNNNHIGDLSPLSGLHNLGHLDIHENGLADLSALSGLDDLRYLNAHGNQISDISSLGGLTGLHTLVISQNRISDVSPLSSLADLRELNLSENQIADISPLAGLTSLTSLDLRANPLNQEAYEVYVPRILANNPGIDLQCLLSLSISSGEGGSVVEPGEGQFTYKYNDTVCLSAQADPGFVFTHWSGTLYSSQNPYYLTVCSEHQMTANFAGTSSPLYLYVDDDAPDDPAPKDPNESDPQEDGTAEHPFDCIQEAVDAALSGDCIRICSGTYRETVDLAGKSIELRGIDPEDSDRMGWPVIDGAGNGPVVSVYPVGEEPNCTLVGLVLTGGKDPLAAAIS
ncbi:MAG: leucine-rich repeat domain-containing protein, partial [Phycisphaerales bacterium]